MIRSTIRLLLVVAGLALSSCSAVRYNTFTTARGVVQCPDANTVEDPTDGVLQELTRPRTTWAVEFCASY